MTLAMIEQDLGKEVSRSVARMLVVYYQRPGGQYQFSSLLDFDPGSAESVRCSRMRAITCMKICPLNVWPTLPV